MKLKYVVIALIAFAAYTLGAKAGHSRYTEITRTFTKYWNDPAVKKARKKAGKARQKAGKELQKQASRKAREFRRNH